MKNRVKLPITAARIVGEATASANYRQARDEGGHGHPDPIDDRPDVDAGSFKVLFPFWQRFMHIEDRLVELKARVIEQRHVALKTLANVRLMVATHRNDKVGLFDHLSSQLALDMGCDIGSSEKEPRLNPFVNGLGPGINAGRSNQT